MGLIGIDLHTDSFYAVRTRLTDKRQIRTEKRYELHGASWEMFASTLSKEDYVLIEATTNSFWFRDRVQPLVQECFILNLNKVEFSGNKTDKIDARRLLDVLFYYVHVKGITELPSVYVPRPEVRRLRSLLSTYRLNKRIMTQLKNRIHSLFKQSGIVTTRCKLSPLLCRAMHALGFGSPLFHLDPPEDKHVSCSGLRSLDLPARRGRFGAYAGMFASPSFVPTTYRAQDLNSSRQYSSLIRAAFAGIPRISSEKKGQLLLMLHFPI